ncbi:MAG: hypothetical protein IT326_08470, partial [Anaerolineae bacterium]|nr:hypothetical protein [Anaerolineae bacterium]
RGQGWGMDGYTGASALKVFHVGASLLAFSGVAVTDQVDEQGRRGIRRAEIDLFPVSQYTARLSQRLWRLPAQARIAAERHMTRAWWNVLLDRLIPRPGVARQVILTCPFTSPARWQMVEAIVLMVALSRGIQMIEGWSAAPSLTTLALDYHEESQIVAVPQQALGRIRGVSPIHIQ